LVDGDPIRLGQVVTNLRTNAIKLTAPGGHLVIDVRPSVDQRSAILTVADDGPGIAAAQQLVAAHPKLRS